MEHFLSDIPWAFPRIAWLAHLDEVCIFGEPACVQVQGNLLSRADFFDRLDICHGNWLPAAGIVRNSDHHQRNALNTDPFDQLLETGSIHVAFERMVTCRFERLRYGEVDCFGPHEFAVRPRGIEMHVVWDDVTFLAHDAEKNALSCPSLVSGND